MHPTQAPIGNQLIIYKPIESLNLTKKDFLTQPFNINLPEFHAFQKTILEIIHKGNSSTTQDDFNVFSNVWRLMSEKKKDKFGNYFKFTSLINDCNLKLFKYLVKGMDSRVIDAGNPLGEACDTILHILIKTKPKNSVDLYEKIDTLINYGANVNLANNDLLSPLACAAEHDSSTSAIVLLILSGAIYLKPLSKAGQMRIDTAVEQIFEKSRLILILNHETQSVFAGLPKISKDLICNLTVKLVFPHHSHLIYSRSKKKLVKLW